jgi:hypothetical protein
MKVEFSTLIFFIVTVVILFYVISSLISRYPKAIEGNNDGWNEFRKRTGLNNIKSNSMNTIFAFGIYLGYKVEYSITPIGGYEFGYARVFTDASLKLNKQINKPFSIEKDNLLPKNGSFLGKNKLDDKHSMKREIGIFLHKQLEYTYLPNHMGQIDFVRLFVCKDEIIIRLNGVEKNPGVLRAVLDILVGIANITELNSIISNGEPCV